MDFSRIGTGHRIAAGAGLLLLIDLWLSWYKLSEDFGAGAAGFDTSITAWQSFDLTDILLALTALLAIAAALQHMGVFRLPTRLSGILLPLAGVMTLWVLYRIINSPEDNDLLDVAFGAYLGLVLTAVMTYGAMKAQSETEAVGPAEINTGSRTTAGTTAGTTSAPPPPPPASTTPPPSDPPPPPPATG